MLNIKKSNRIKNTTIRSKTKLAVFYLTHQKTQMEMDRPHYAWGRKMEQGYDGILGTRRGNAADNLKDGRMI